MSTRGSSPITPRWIRMTAGYPGGTRIDSTLRQPRRDLPDAFRQRLRNGIPGVVPQNILARTWAEIVDLAMQDSKARSRELPSVRRAEVVVVGPRVALRAQLRT